MAMPPAFKGAGAAIAFSLLAGWSVQRDTPQGIALTNTGEPCAALSHGFASMYSVVLGVITGMVIVVGLGALIASNLGLLSQAKTRLSSLVSTCMVLGALLLGAQLLNPVIKTLVAQAPAPPCVKTK
jgi:hypothetical protein